MAQPAACFEIYIWAMIIIIQVPPHWAIYSIADDDKVLQDRLIENFYWIFNLNIRNRIIGTETDSLILCYDIIFIVSARASSLLNCSTNGWWCYETANFFGMLNKVNKFNNIVSFAFIFQSFHFL